MAISIDYFGIVGGAEIMKDMLRRRYRESCFTCIVENQLRKTCWQCLLFSVLSSVGFYIFSRAVALLFNCEYFRGLKSHEILPGMKCLQMIAGDVWMTWEVWNLMRVDQGQCMLSGCHLYTIWKHACHLHVCNNRYRGNNYFFNEQNVHNFELWAKGQRG